MKRRFGFVRGSGSFVVWLMLGTALVAAVHFGLPSRGEAHAVIDEPLRNFGHVAPGAELRHTFTIRNEGNGKLRIGSIHSTCGCTEAQVSDRVLRQGRSAVLRVAFRAPEQPGSSRQIVSLFTNDPQNPVHALTVEARVVVPMEVQPRQIDFGIVERAELPAKRAANVLLGPQFTHAASLLRAESTSEFLTVVVAPPAENETAMTLVAV